MYSTLLVSDLSISFSIFIVVVFSLLFFYDMIVSYIHAQLYVVKQIQVLRFLKMTSVKFLSMNSYCWALESWVL